MIGTRKLYKGCIREVQTKIALLVTQVQKAEGSRPGSSAVRIPSSVPAMILARQEIIDDAEQKSHALEQKPTSP